MLTAEKAQVTDTRGGLAHTPIAQFLPIGGCNGCECPRQHSDEAAKCSGLIRCVIWIQLGYGKCTPVRCCQEDVKYLTKLLQFETGGARSVADILGNRKRRERKHINVDMNKQTVKPAPPCPCLFGCSRRVCFDLRQSDVSNAIARDRF